MNKILIIGGGASGIMSALTAKNEQNTVTIIEKNKVIGQKLSITGSSRCNITNLDTKEDFLAHIMESEKFFYSSFSQFSNYDFITYLQSIGISLKYEGVRAYPSHESAQKLVNVLIKKLEEKNVNLHTNEEMIDIKVSNETVKSITTNKKKYLLEKDFTDVIIATGGLSYTKNHTFEILKNKLPITRLYPSLTNIQTLKNVKELSGISLNVKISATIDSKTYSIVDDILFTQNGISGPAVMNLTGYIVKYQDECNDISDYKKINYTKPISYKGQKIFVNVDFLPNISDKGLDKILFDNSKKQLKTKMSSYIPTRLAKFLLEKYDSKDIFNLTKQEKNAIINSIKNYRLQVKTYGNINSAIVTKGGIDTKIISPKNMKCKTIQNLYFAGECMDIDALEGGYNLQIAFSTGYVVGANFI